METETERHTYSYIQTDTNIHTDREGSAGGKGEAHNPSLYTLMRQVRSVIKTP